MDDVFHLICGMQAIREKMTNSVSRRDFLKLVVFTSLSMSVPPLTKSADQLSQPQEEKQNVLVDNQSPIRQQALLFLPPVQVQKLLYVVRFHC